jgi:hypothetical protein
MQNLGKTKEGIMTEFTMGQDVPKPPKARDTSVDKNKAVLNYIMNSLRATKPWTRLLSILGFIGTGLTVLMGLGIMVGGNFIPISPKAPPLAYLGIFYILTSFFYLVPSIWLSKYSSAIDSFLKGGDSVQSSAMRSLTRNLSGNLLGSWCWCLLSSRSWAFLLRF